MNNMKKAMESLTDIENTFAAAGGETLYLSQKKGIAPLMELLKKDETCLQGFCVADRVIGKAAAFLLIKAEVEQLYAEIISTHALDLLKQSTIQVSFGEKVPYIVNRNKTGMCPMEESVLLLEKHVQAEEAYRILEDKCNSIITKNK